MKIKTETEDKFVFKIFKESAKKFWNLNNSNNYCTWFCLVWIEQCATGKARKFNITEMSNFLEVQEALNDILTRQCDPDNKYSTLLRIFLTLNGSL